MEFIEKISDIQKTTDSSIEELSLFIKGMFTKQDAVIKILKDRQLSMNRRMTTVTDNMQNQMDAMNLTLGNLQNILLRTLG